MPEEPEEAEDLEEPEEPPDDPEVAGAACVEVEHGDNAGNGSGTRRSARLRGASKPLRVDGYNLPKDAWKQFTPKEIDLNKCLARVWGNGRGGQCPHRPCGGKSLCSRHDQQAQGAGLPHGYVTGEIPRGKLAEFYAAFRGRDEKELKQEAAVQRALAHGQSTKTAARGKKY